MIGSNHYHQTAGYRRREKALLNNFTIMNNNFLIYINDKFLTRTIFK